MIDFSKYVAQSNSDSNFLNTVTVEEVKKSQGDAPLRVIPSPNKQGKFFFACGQIIGYVADKLAAKMVAKQPFETVVVSEVRTKDGKTLLTLHEQGTNSNVIAAF